MVIKEIHLRNFATHKKEDVAFPKEGIFLLAGRNGIGKSSFLEAIGFALYGYHATRAKTIEELRHRDVGSDDEMSVRILFEDTRGATYEVFRGVVNGETTVRAVDAEGIAYEGPASVKSCLEEVLGGLDAKTFYLSFFAQQNDLATLTTMRGGERRAFIHKMLGINLLDAANKEAGTQVRKAASHIEVNEEILADRPVDIIQSELLNNRNDIITAFIEQSQAQDVYDKMKTELDVLETNAKNLREDREKHLEAKQMIKLLRDGKLPQLQKTLTEKQAVLETMKEKRNFVKENQDVETEAAELREKREKLLEEQKLHQQRQNLEEKIVRGKEKLATISIETEDLGVLEVNEEELRESLTQMREEIAALNNRSAELEQNKKLLLDQEECAVCLRPLIGKEAQTVLENIDSQITEAQSLIEAKSVEIENLSVQVETAKKYEQEKSKIQANLQATQVTLEELEAELKELITPKIRKEEIVSQLQKFTTKLATIDELVKEVGYAKRFLEENQEVDAEIEQLIEENEALNKELDDQGVALRDSTFEEEAYNENEIKTQSTRSKLEEIKEAVLKTTHSCQSHSQEMIRLGSEFVKQEEKERALKEDREKLKTISELNVLIKEFKQHLSAQIRPQIEEVTSEMFNTLSNGKFPSMSVDENYEIYVEYMGGKMPIRLVSGGEEQRANLCLRLALTRLVSARSGAPIRFIVLDEIFGNQDEDYRQLIVDSLEELRAYYPQIFLVSHVGDLNDSEFINAIINFDDEKDEHRAEVVVRA